MKNSVILSVILLASWATFCPTSAAQNSDTLESRQLDTDTKSNWVALATDGPQSTAAAMWFIDHPTTAIELFAERLKPLNLDQERFDDLLEELASSDEAIWQAAYQELSYFDPRLLGNAVDIISSIPDGPALQRLGGILSKHSIEMFLQPSVQSRFFSKPFSLQASGDKFAMVASGSPLYRIPTTMSAIHNGFRKLDWDRLNRALAVLDAINSPEASGLIEEVAKGHEAAGPTKFAKRLLARDSEVGKASLDSMLDWWQRMKQRGGEATYAAIQFRLHPEQAVKFLDTRFDPVTLSERELGQLLEQLFSDDELAWNSAFEELEYKDPRIVKGPIEIFESVDDQKGRNRLVAILCGYSIEQIGKFDSMDINGEDAYLYLLGDTISCKWGNVGLYVETDIRRLGNTLSGTKPSWNRACHAIAVLNSIGTDAAIEKVKQIAGGHEQATPTIFAKEALENKE